ncbi:hypothetical protein [Lentzea sp. NPDC092896]|uniref:hypothetical protein n=1 Tax=Lentzea sp. NPDC092896 TaxID=3364127 RepID=UPI0038175BCA
MDEPSRVREAAALIRGCLPDLVSADDANTIDRVVSHLLNDADMDRSELAVQLIQVLDTHARIRTWVRRVLDDDKLRPPEIQEVEERGVDPIGSPRPVRARCFKCPYGDFIWYQRTAAHTPPNCPTHSGALVAA